MKEMITTIFSLLRKFNRLWVFNLSMIGVLILCIAMLITNMFELVVGIFFLLFMCAWEISDVFLFEKQAILERELANEKDKLVLAEHKMERLQLELETTQSALLKAKEYKLDTPVQSTKSKPAPDSTEAKPKPKRPAFKRKPKPKQAENENQN